jgi:two-component sensor histidine kinase/CHASE1-domain containing sensor protein
MAQEGFRHETAAWLVMGAAIALAVLSWGVALQQDQRQAELRFKVAVDGTVDTLAGRIHGYELALRSARALHGASERVERDEWRRFVGALRLQETLPGIQAIGYARLVQQAEIGRFVESARLSGEPEFTVADGPAGVARVIVEMIEPLDPAHRLMLGTDLDADASRREAMTIARDSGQTTISSPIRLRSEGGGARPAIAWLMFLPTYATDGEPRDRAERRATLRGYVYSPIRGEDLMRGILPRETPGLGVRVFDGSGSRTEDLVHATALGAPAQNAARRLLQLPGRVLTLEFAGTADFDRAARISQPLIVGTVGALMNVALLLYLRSESRERRRAVGEAQRLAAEVEGRRGAEQAMRNSDRRFRDVVTASPTGLVMADRDGRIVLANPQAEKLFGYGHDALLGRPLDDLVPGALGNPIADPSDGTIADPSDGAAQSPVGEPPGLARSDGRDVRGRRSDGTVFPLEIGLSPISSGAAATTLVAMVDLSARQAAQDQLAAALREKTVLLDEVHHRVKNNLQVITSLLSLQSRGAPPEARAALADCRNRVHAMALTHQLLHENNDMARLHVGQYLTRLTRLLADSNRSAAGTVTLRVAGVDAPLYLDLPHAIPCGLLVNELVTNAYKHAFPGGRHGAIDIGMALEDGTARLTVGDDGIGLPPDLDPEAARSLGFQLVPLLVDQLGATLRRLPGPGTRYEIRFPAEPEPHYDAGLPMTEVRP